MCQACISPAEHCDEEEIDIVPVVEDRRIERVLHIIDGSVIVTYQEIVGEIDNQLQVTELIAEHPSPANLEQDSHEQTSIQYDEMNPLFFTEGDSFAEPSFVHQEL